MEYKYKGFDLCFYTFWYVDKRKIVQMCHWYFKQKVFIGSLDWSSAFGKGF